ncbi:recombinase family protein [Streptococcus suis]|uniref:UDP-N-acetylglucosamine kinase n=24 Tax=Bacteria TaxID=2 RepID=A0AA96VEX8_9STRE|nr:recombinase family protein [Streptococcus suis]WNY47026.1 zeta toxin family protein [Streptococcus sp. 29896]HEL1685536.1 zeta toxin family protein [Streptococcus suis]
MANIVNFTDKQFENRLNDNLEELVQGKKAVESPTAFLLGGQPGSGKTSLRSAILEETQGNVIVIDNDTFKQQHPNFDELAKLYEKDVVKHVTPYSNRMTEAIISRLSDQGYNLVIEGTGRTTDVPIQTATMLQAKGYETKMYVMAVPKINSYLGTIERYETMYADDPMTARATPKQAHDIVVKNLPTNLETLHKTGLFSDIRLYNREGVKLYSSLETPSISPKETLERELNRKVSGKEIQPTLERIEQKMVQNQHQETPEFKAIQQKANKDRPQLQAMLAYIREGDIVVVTELERLGRNNKELTEVMNDIQAKGATLEVLNLPTLRGIEDDNLRRLLNNLILELYKYQAQAERERIKERQRQGIAIAKTQGKYKGRKAIFSEDDSRLLHAFDLYLEGLSDKDVAKLTGINERTFRRYREKHKIKR